MSAAPHQEIGVVAIGRNEGERLMRCLRSVKDEAALIVYVDSGSTDGSVRRARELGAAIVELDMSKPFTAARARNEGIRHLKALMPQVEFVQVVDGDCEVVGGWIDRAHQRMLEDAKLAVACGRRREEHPEASIYNRLCDMEWNTPVGPARACGGDALIRLRAFDSVRGYDPLLIAGEEPEFCHRLVSNRWKIERIDAEMTLHDAQIAEFGQWWKRMVRSGHAYAEGRAMHGRDGYCVREIRSIIEWTVLLPLVAISFAWLTWGMSLLLLAGYIVLWGRIRKHRLASGDSPDDASLYAQYCVLGKFAQLVGFLTYWKNRFLGRQARIIEYKQVAAGPELGLSEGGKP